MTVNYGGEGQKVHNRQSGKKPAPLDKPTASGRAKN